MKHETWKPIKGYEDIYQISDQGHIRSVDHLTLKVGASFHMYAYLGRELHPTLKSHGSPVITLRKGKEKHTYSVSKLVAKHFMLGYTEDKSLYFLNGNRADCRLINLGVKEHGSKEIQKTYSRAMD